MKGGTQAWHVARIEARLQLRDPSPVVVMTALPVILMLLLRPTYDRLLQGDGTAGAGTAVAGMGVMGSLMLVSYVGFVFYREHGWRTWDRYRATGVGTGPLVAGKLVVPLLAILLQLCAIHLAGALFLGLRVRGSWLALVVIAFVYVLVLEALALVGVALCRTVMQMTALANIFGLLLSGLGGALVPRDVLPEWASSLSLATPSYWCVRGLTRVYSGGSLEEVRGEVGALAAFAVVLAALVLITFRSATSKESWS